MKLKRSLLIAFVTLVPGVALAADGLGITSGCCPFCPF
jgi:hypothetical protein